MVVQFIMRKSSVCFTDTRNVLMFSFYVNNSSVSEKMIGACRD